MQRMQNYKYVYAIAFVYSIVGYHTSPHLFLIATEYTQMQLHIMKMTPARVVE
jgi:hypothetical protein